MGEVGWGDAAQDESADPTRPRASVGKLRAAAIATLGLAVSGIALLGANYTDPANDADKNYARQAQDTLSAQPTDSPTSSTAAPPPSVPASTPPLEWTDRTYRAFSPDSWWNAPLPDDPPLHPEARLLLDYMSTAPESGDGCLLLAGAGANDWGHPIYWADEADPVYNVSGLEYARPPELDQLRIPRSARPAANNDGSMSIYDLGRGYVTALTNAVYDPGADQWTASGATVTYLRSNGLHVDTGLADDVRNEGTHRGNNGATMTVSWDMVQAGEISHVLKVALGPEVADRFVFPMVGSDGDYDGDSAAVPPQGLRLRLKPAVDLDSLQLSPQAHVIAMALQRYGFYIGDSGGVTALKLENTRAEGRGNLWEVSSRDLCGLPFIPAYWDVLAEGYDPSR